MANEMVSMYYQNLITILTKNILETEKRINILTLQDTAQTILHLLKFIMLAPMMLKAQKKKLPGVIHFTCRVTDFENQKDSFEILFSFKASRDCTRFCHHTFLVSISCLVYILKGAILVDVIVVMGEIY